MPNRSHLLLMSVLLVLLAAPAALSANDGGDRVQFFQNIAVSENDKAGDLVCIFCSVRMAGTSTDVVAIFGNVIVAGDVKGDVVSVGGGIKLDEGANVTGDTVAIGRGVYRHPNAIVKGEIVSQSGFVIMLGLIVVPLLPFLLVIMLVVWLVRRNQGPAPAQTAYRRQA